MPFGGGIALPPRDLPYTLYGTFNHADGRTEVESFTWDPLKYRWDGPHGVYLDGAFVVWDGGDFRQAQAPAYLHPFDMAFECAGFWLFITE